MNKFLDIDTLGHSCKENGCTGIYVDKGAKGYFWWDEYEAVTCNICGKEFPRYLRGVNFFIDENCPPK